MHHVPEAVRRADAVSDRPKAANGRGHRWWGTLRICPVCRRCLCYVCHPKGPCVDDRQAPGLTAPPPQGRPVAAGGALTTASPGARLRVHSSGGRTGPMKARRQALIIELVDHEAIANQDQLQRLLHGRGIETTQATISRDIKELGLVKRAADGAYQRAGCAVVEPRGRAHRSAQGARPVPRAHRSGPGACGPQDRRWAGPDAGPCDRSSRPGRGCRHGGRRRHHPRRLPEREAGDRAGPPVRAPGRIVSVRRRSALAVRDSPDRRLAPAGSPQIVRRARDEALSRF